MAIKFRNYRGGSGFGEEFRQVKAFLMRINQEKAVTPGFPWGRWEWFFSLTFNKLDDISLATIGIWEEEGSIVALATYEGPLNQAYLCVDEKHSILYGEMLAYVKANMGGEGKVAVLVSDNDRLLQREARKQGFRPTQEKEHNAMLDIGYGGLSYTLPEGYTIKSLADEYDLKKYNSVLWRGFNHPGEPPETEEDLESRRISLSGPGVNLHLKVAAVAPNGDFVSYCGMWYEPGTPFALVEPVATDPRYRKMGLGRAAVLEGVRRCGEMGAKQAFVGSSQQFYYNIGFAPYSTDTFWEYLY